MAQHDYFLENQTAANYRTDHNNCLAAIVSNNSGDTEPSPTFAFQIWVDTSGATDIVKQRNADNDAWIEIYRLTTSAQTIQNLDVSGNITVDGTVDGRDVAADGTKLDGIESGATADQTAAEIRTLVESASDSNVFTDADHTKLNGIETGATADQTKADIDALNIDAGTLDGIDSGSFIRSDTSDEVTGSTTWNVASTASIRIKKPNTTSYAGITFDEAGDSRYLFYMNNAADGNLILQSRKNGSNIRTVFNVDEANGRLTFGSDAYVNSNKIWHAGNDGSGTGLDADKLDGQHESYFLNTSSTAQTKTGNLTISKSLPKLILDSPSTGDDFTSQGAQISIGESGDGGSAALHLTYRGNGYAYIGMGTLSDGIPPFSTIRFKYNSNQIVASGTLIADGFAPQNGGTITDASGNFGSIKVTGGSTGGWKGYAIEDGAVFMQNDANSAFGLYDDTNNHWAVYHVKNAATYLYYDGVNKFNTTSTGVQVNGQLSVYKPDNNVSDHIRFYNDTTRVGEIGCEDTTWLRINQETNKNIYTPRYIRADNGFYIDGTTFGFTGDATLKTKNGTSSAPSHTFGNDTNTGVFRVTADSLGFSAGGTRRGRLTGNTVDFPGVYNATTSGGTTVKVNSSGRLRRASSSRNVKTNIEPMDAAYAIKLLNEAQPVWYRPRIPDPEYPQQYLDSLEENESPGIYECEAFCLDNDIDWEVGDKWMNEGENPAHSHWGFIAEDLAEVDPRLCYLNPDTNTWDSVDYEKFTPVLLKLAQMQKEEIAQTNSLLQTALTRIEALEAKVAALESGAS